jgi:hypothetical protein
MPYGCRSFGRPFSTLVRALRWEAFGQTTNVNFGRWLYGSRLSAADRMTESYQEVRRLHAEFHDLAALVVERAAAGRIVEAYALLYDEYVTMSGRLALAMRAWQQRLLKGLE